MTIFLFVIAAIFVFSPGFACGMEFILSDFEQMSAAEFFDWKNQQ